MNLYLTIFHIYHFVIGKLQTLFLPNIQNKARTKLSNKPKNIYVRKIRIGPITSTFGTLKTGLIIHRRSKMC